MNSKDTVYFEKRVYLIDKPWIQAQLQRLGLTQATLAAQMDVEPVVLSYVINGTRELKVSQAASIAKIFGVPLEEVIRRWGFPVAEQSTAPVKFVVRDDMTATKLRAPYIEAPLPPGFTADSYAVRMQPTHGVGGFWDGMLCFIAPGNHDVRDCAGRLSLVETEDKRRLFGVMSRPDDKGEYTLVHPGQRNTEENVKVLTASPATWFRAA